MACGYVIVLFETCCSSTWKYLSSLSPKDQDDGKGHIQSLIHEKPTVKVYFEAWHNKKKKTEVKHKRNGVTVHKEIRTDSSRKKVTWSGWFDFVFDYWRDESDVKNIPSAEQNTILRVRLDPFVYFANKETKKEFERQKKAYKQANKHRDKYFDEKGKSFAVPGLKNNVMFSSSKNIPWWMNTCVYLLCTLVCCSWPYRWYLRHSTKKQHFLSLIHI